MLNLLFNIVEGSTPVFDIAICLLLQNSLRIYTVTKLLYSKHCLARWKWKRVAGQQIRICENRGNSKHAIWSFERFNNTIYS